MTQQTLTTEKKRLSTVQYLFEVLLGWRYLFPAVPGHCQTADIDRVAGAFRADFVRLPVLRFLALDPVNTYAAHREFFRWAQTLCSKCSRQNDCSRLAAQANALPAFDQYCANAAKFHQRMAVEGVRQWR